MSVTSNLEKAEEAIRQALIHALAEGEDHLLTDLFDQLTSVRNLKKKITNTIRFSDNTEDYYERLNDPDYKVDLTTSFGETNFTVNSKRSGKDLDVMDNIIEFPSNVPSIFNDDVITFTDDTITKPGLTE